MTTIGTHILIPEGFPTTNEEIAALAANYERESQAREQTRRELQVDTRNPDQLRNEFNQQQWLIAENARTLAEVSRWNREATEKLSVLRKLKKQYDKNLETQPCYRRSAEEIDEKVAAQEQALAGLKNRETGLTRLVAEGKQLLAEFLQSTPKKKWKTNKEILADYDEMSTLEEHLRRI